LPRLFTDEELKELKSEQKFTIEHFSFLKKIPGGQGLLARIENI